MISKMHSSVLIAVLLFCGVVALNWDATSTAVQFWDTSHNYQHGGMLVIVLLAIMFLAVLRARPNIQSMSWTSWCLIMVFGCALVVSTIAQVLVLQIALLMAMIWLIGLALFGWDFARTTLYPFVLAIFSIPVWDFLIQPLQQTTIDVVNYLLGVLRRTSYVEGDLIVLRHGQFLVEHGCSGMNFFITGLMLSGLYAHWNVNGWLAKVGVILAGAAASLVANWARVFIIVMAGDMTQMRHPLVETHTLFGWVVFGIVTAIMMGLGYLLLPAVEDDDVGEASSRELDASSAESSRLRFLLLIPAMSALLLPGILFLGMRSVYGDPADVDVQLTMTDTQASVSDAARAAMTLELAYFPDAVTHTTEHFAFDNQVFRVDVFANDLRDRQRELVGYPNRWYDPAVWSVAEVELLEGESVRSTPPLDVLTLSSVAGDVVVVTGYLFADAITSSKIVAKVLGTIGYLTRQFPAGAFVVSAPCKPDCNRTRQTLVQFADELLAQDVIQLSSREQTTVAVNAPGQSEEMRP